VHRDNIEDSADGQARVATANLQQTVKSRSSRSTSVSRILFVAVLVSLAAACYDGVITRKRRGGRSNGEIKSTNNSELSSNHEVVSAKPIDWRQCKANLTPTPNNAKPANNNRIEPIWLPTYPTSLPEGYAALLSSLTGLPQAARNYYRQSKSLKRCHSKPTHANIDGVTCEVVHPIIPMQRPSPSAQAGNFGKALIMAIRNPLTASFYSVYFVSVLLTMVVMQGVPSFSSREDGEVPRCAGSSVEGGMDKVPG